MENIGLLSFTTFMETKGFLAAIQLLIIIIATYLKNRPTANVKGYNLLIWGFSALIISTICVAFRINWDFIIFSLLEIASFCIALGCFFTAGFVFKGWRGNIYQSSWILSLIIFALLIYAVYFSGAEYLVYIIRFGALSMAFWALAFGFYPKSTKKASYGLYASSFSFLILGLLTFFMMLGWGRTFFGENIFALVYFVTAISLSLSGANLLEDKIEELESDVKAISDRFKLIIQSSPFPVIISRVKDEKFILANRRAEQFLGLEINKLRSYRLMDFFTEGSFKKGQQAKREKANQIEEQELQLNGQKVPVDAAGTWVQVSSHIMDFEYEIARYTVIQDINERKKKEIELFHEATRDSLTDCYTRRFFQELAQNEIHRSIRYNRPFCLLMIDADHFKNINDTYGHNVGDKVLQTLAKTCMDSLRKSDIVCRFGGEEFMIMLVEVELSVAKIVCDRLRKSIENILIKEPNGDIKFTVSMGLVPSSFSTNYSNLIKAADEALYIAKKSGRNRLIAVSPKTSNNIAETETVPKQSESSISTAPNEIEDEPKPIPIKQNMLDEETETFFF